MGSAMALAKTGHQKIKDSQQMQDSKVVLQQGAEMAGNLALAAAGEAAAADQSGKRATFGGHLKRERMYCSAP